MNPPWAARGRPFAVRLELASEPSPVAVTFRMVVSPWDQMMNPEPSPTRSVSMISNVPDVTRMYRGREAGGLKVISHPLSVSLAAPVTSTSSVRTRFWSLYRVSLVICKASAGSEASIKAVAKRQIASRAAAVAHLPMGVGVRDMAAPGSR